MRVLVPVCGLVVAFSAAVASACSCAPPPPPKKALQTSAAVFVGKVTKIERGQGFLAPLTVTLKISRTWKGTEGQTVVVKTSGSGASCGYGFKQGQEYLVYCHRPPKKKDAPLDVSLCSRTKKLADAKEDLNALGEGEKP